MRTNKPAERKSLVIILLILSIAINIIFRLDPLFLPQFDRTARNEVYSSIKGYLLQDASLALVSASGQERSKALGELFASYMKANGPLVKEFISRRAREMKSYYQDDGGWTYLRETDSYRWMRRVENYLNSGHFGTRVFGGQDYDDLESAPLGERVQPMRLHFYLSAYFYKALHFCNNRLTLMNCLGLLPVALTPVLVAAIFYLCLLFGMNAVAGFAASLFVGLAPVALTRTAFGWFDTDIYNLFMPVIILSCLAQSFGVKKNSRRIYFSY
jgi:hypothetical protein